MSNLIEEAVLNAGFAAVSKLDMKVAKDIMKEISQVLEQFVVLETQEAGSLGRLMRE